MSIIYHVRVWSTGKLDIWMDGAFFGSFQNWMHLLSLKSFRRAMEDGRLRVSSRAGGSYGDPTCPDSMSKFRA